MKNKEKLKNMIEVKEDLRELKNALNSKNFDTEDLTYMSSLSEAVLQKSPKATKYILWFIVLFLASFVFWADQAQVDEITRGNGKIIPSHQLQIVQNLEGGIVSEINIQEGDQVKKGQILLKIDSTNFSSSFEESKLKELELEAKLIRLNLEAGGSRVFNVQDEKMSSQIAAEKSLFESRIDQLNKSISVVVEQKNQKISELAELNAKIKQQEEAYKLIQQEVNITRPLFNKGLISEVEFLQLRRQLNSLKGEFESSKLAIPRIKSSIKELDTKIQEIYLDFKNRAKEESNEVMAELLRVKETQTALEDRVKRTFVRSPVDGTINQLLINTISGVVQPGMDLVEIVPEQDNLLVEAKVKPSEIAFLRPGLEAMVKFSAYDFAIHGGLKGKLTHISADTMTDEKDETYYLVRIKTDKNHLGSDERPLHIMVGMTVSVDIITGKKSVLDYLLKPILKAKQSALRER